MTGWATPLARFRGFLDDAARSLAEDRPAQDPALLLAAARHAVDFQTWRALVLDGGLSRGQAVELASAMVRRAAG